MIYHFNLDRLINIIEELQSKDIDFDKDYYATRALEYKLANAYDQREYCIGVQYGLELAQNYFVENCKKGLAIYKASMLQYLVVGEPHDGITVGDINGVRGGLGYAPPSGGNDGALDKSGYGLDGSKGASMENQKKNKEQPKQENELWRIYGARPSKSGKRYNITIITGDDDNKRYGCISLPVEKVRVKDGNLYVKINLLVDKQEEKDVLDF